MILDSKYTLKRFTVFCNQIPLLSIESPLLHTEIALNELVAKRSNIDI